MKIRAVLLAIIAAMSFGCDGAIMDAPNDDPVLPDPPDEVLDPPTVEANPLDPLGHTPTAGTGNSDPTDTAIQRRVRRLTADQFNRSLTVATGQTWGAFEANAQTLGRPDFIQVTVEGQELSVTFDKLVGDAARVTCRAAVTADLANADVGSRVILRHIEDIDDTTAEAEETNLKYLIKRFHGHNVENDDDGRLDPWTTMLNAEIDTPEGEEPATRADIWAAVCVGLVSHPDFLTY